MSESESNSFLKVLVIDDVSAARKVTVRILKKLAISNIHEAESVSQAMSLIESNDFNLIVSDVHLKDGKGTDLLPLLKENPKAENLKTIFITSDMEKNTFVNAIQFGVTTYLLKPFSPELLSDKILSLFPSSYKATPKTELSN